MNLEESIYTYLSGYAALTTYVNNKIYPLNIPDKTKNPAIAYKRISGVRTAVLQGYTGETNPVIQFTCKADTYSEMKTVQEKLRIALENFTGQMGGGVTINAVLLEADFDVYDDETSEYISFTDFRFFHKENIT
jgi:hypothetical protein